MRKSKQKDLKLERLQNLGSVFDSNGPVVEKYQRSDKASTKALFHQPGTFVSAAENIEECDELNPNQIPEIAFAGKSNVGKSSLLNALMRTTVVKTSKSPGRTKGLNFFEVGGDQFRLVDLPGYGYARASKDTVDDLHRRIYEYLFFRDQRVLAMVFLLIDIRRGQPSAADIELMKAMDREGTRYRIILTKADTVTSEHDIKQCIVNTTYVMKNLLACDPVVNLVSSKYHFGIRSLQNAIGQSHAERRQLLTLRDSEANYFVT